MSITYSSITDPAALQALHISVAEGAGGFLARSADECSLSYFQTVIEHSLSSGINIGAYDGDKLVGFIYAYKSRLKVFNHVLSNMTLGVHPQYQNQGIGKNLVSRFMIDVESKKDIIRIELFTVEVNKQAIKLYESFGFKQEGVFRDRAVLNNKLVNDIAMAWLRS